MEIITTLRSWFSDGQESNGVFLPEREVIQFLEGRGGGAWQGEVLNEFGWTPSKTSRVLSSMEDNGMVTRMQIGREKIVQLPEDHEGDVTGGARSRTIAPQLGAK